MGRQVLYTLCWDCENAVDPEICPWVAEGKPVPGWWAHKRTIGPNRYHAETYCVYSCPLFVRDAENGGLEEWGEEK